MGIEYFLQQLVNGICLGGMYALMSVGYSLVYSIMNFSNFAHGGVIMVGAYVGYFALTALNVPFLPAFLLCGVGSGLLAVIIERLVYSPLRKRHAPSLYFIISAMGASIFLENFVIATIDGTPRNYPPIFDNRINIGGISLGVDSLLMIVVSAVALLILMFIIQKTKVGLAILSVMEPDLVALAISAGDHKAFKAASGVGPKLAQRIVLELKDKVAKGFVEGINLEDVAGAAADTPAAQGAGQAIAALVSLGYSQSEAALAVSKIDGTLPVEEIIKLALRGMAGRR